MKKIPYTLLFLFLITGACAQDVIIKKNGDEIPAKVVEVGSVEIKYKKSETSDGPFYTIPRVDIFMIKYADGSKDIITDLNAERKEKRSGKTFKSYIAVNAGVGIPIGTFSQRNPDDSGSGYALPGVEFNLSYTFPLVSYLRAGIKIGENINSLDEGKLMDNIRAGYSGSDWTAYLDDMRPISRMYFLAGPSAIMPGEKISLEIRTFAGVSSSYYPGYAFTAYNNTGTNISYAYGSATSTSFAYDIGLGMLYSFSNKLSGAINLDFISSNDEFTHSGTVSSSGWYNPFVNSVSFSANRQISVFALTAGIYYAIGK